MSELRRPLRVLLLHLQVTHQVGNWVGLTDFGYSTVCQILLGLNESLAEGAEQLGRIGGTFI